MLSITRTGAPTPSEQAAIDALAEAALAADGIDPLNEAARFAVRGQRPAVHWLAASSGSKRLRGYAQLDAETRSLILVVHPEARRQGLGSDLLALVRTVEKRPTIWAFGNLPAAQAFGAHNRLTVVRELLVMKRDLTTAPVSVAVADAAPDGVQIAGFRASDLGALVEVNAEAFAGHPEQGDLGDTDFLARMGEDWFDPSGLLLAHDDDTGRLLGYHWTKVEPDAPHEGEVYAIAVVPDAAGRGIGRALLTAGLALMQQRGVITVLLYVEASSQRVVEMYRSAHFVEINRDASYR